MYDGRIAFIQACWHKDIVDQARDSFLAEIENHDLSPDRVDVFEVPGGLEIPLVAKRLVATGRYGIIVGAGLIVDDGVYRHDFVGTAIIDGMMRVQLDSEVPISSAVLTPQLFHDHDDHLKFFFDHFRIKGAEAAVACAQTLKNMAVISALDSPP
ncbi:MAG: 6,7-dimethyl-8-ribityllumazine synthase [Alphaproteobacteria bacterium]